MFNQKINSKLDNMTFDLALSSMGDFPGPSSMWRGAAPPPCQYSILKMVSNDFSIYN